MRVFLMALSLLMFSRMAYADILEMKSGEYKRGKILKETSDTFLFDSENDGSVVEVRKKDVSIMERDQAAGEKKGGLSFFSVAPKREVDRPASIWDRMMKPSATKKKDPLSDILSAEGQDRSWDKIEKLFQELLSKNPEWQKWLDDLMKNMDAKSGEMQKLFDAAKKASSS